DRDDAPPAPRDRRGRPGAGGGALGERNQDLSAVRLRGGESSPAVRRDVTGGPADSAGPAHRPAARGQADGGARRPETGAREPAPRRGRLVDPPRLLVAVPACGPRVTAARGHREARRDRGRPGRPDRVRVVAGAGTL